MSRPIALLTCTLLALPSGGRSADSGDYLQQIQQQIEALATTPTATGEPDTTAVTAGSQSKDRLPLGLDEGAFETILSEEFGGTYAFFRRLSFEDRQRIFEFYSRNNRVDDIRDAILKLLGGGSLSESGGAGRDRMPPNLNEQQFETILSEEFGGTYAFFRRLSFEDRQRIFELYRRDNRVTTLRENILKLLGSRP